MNLNTPPAPLAGYLNLWYKKENVHIMPTAQELDESWAAEQALNRGIPPGADYKDRLLGDPTYRAQQEGISNHEMRRASRNVRRVGSMYYNKRRGLLVTVLFNELAILDESGEITGIARYSPETRTETYSPI